MSNENTRASRDAVLISGGTTGIGLAISLRFIAEGNEVYTLSRRGEENAQELDRQVKERGLARPHVLQADVSDRARLVEIAGELDEAGVRLRTVVASAGINVREIALTVSDAAVRSMIDINLYGLMATFQVFGPLALKQPGSRFIAISSLNALQGMKLRAPYSAHQGRRERLRAGPGGRVGTVGRNSQRDRTRYHRNAPHPGLHGGKSGAAGCRDRPYASRAPGIGRGYRPHGDVPGLQGCGLHQRPYARGRRRAVGGKFLVVASRRPLHQPGEDLDATLSKVHVGPWQAGSSS